MNQSSGKGNGLVFTYNKYIRITYIYNYNYIYYRFCLKKNGKKQTPAVDD